MELKTRDMLGEVELVNDRMYNVLHQTGCERSEYTKGRLERYTTKDLVLDISTKYNGKVIVIDYSSIATIREVEEC